MLGDLHGHDHDDRVLVDYRTSDDAGVYWWDESRALVQTVDFFTPIVDDPFTYGQIAAANSLSDVYAMGGRPLTALAIAAFPKDAGRNTLRDIFEGGLSKLREAGVALLGGHTVQDAEIKFGYAVTGEVAPDAIWSNAGAKPGDVLFLTKAIGTGIIATALKYGRAPEAAVAAAVASMVTLNRAATEALRPLPGDVVHACTDISGFGLIGHVSEMAAASTCTMDIWCDAVPFLEGALALQPGNVPGGGRTNAEHFSAGLRIMPGVAEDRLSMLHDPQTSGGLLVAVAAGHAEAAAAALRGAGVPVARIGKAATPSGALVAVHHGMAPDTSTE